MTKADGVFTNGRIYTVDPAFSVAEAIAVKDGHVLWVGTNEQVKKYVAPETSLFDFGGRTVVPGLVESHLHFLSLGVLLTQIDAAGKSKDDILSEIRDACRAKRKGEWIVGRGWNEVLWGDRKAPTRRALDEVAPDRPVCMVRACGHTIWVNSAALALAGIGRDTPDPVGGEIYRDDEGEPTGILVDTAGDRVCALLPEPGERGLRSAAAAAQARLFSCGITSAHDMAGTSSGGVESTEFYKGLYRDGTLRVGICSYIAGESAGEAYRTPPETGLFGGRFSARGVKFFTDGSLGARSAWMSDDYSDRRGHRGNARYSDDELYNLILEARRNGFQPATHAIGDAANRQVLDAYERVLCEIPEARDHRFRVEHAQILQSADVARFGALGVIPSMQFVHCESDRNMTEERIGTARLGGAFAWRSLLEGGSIIPGGSDAPVESVNPFFGISAAVARDWCPGEKISRAEALRAFTIWGAYAGFEEHSKGSIEVGKLADFAAIDRDLMICPAEELKNTRVTATVLGGEVVYGEL